MTPKKAPKASTVFGSILIVFVPSASKYRTSPALDISPPEFCPLLIPDGRRLTALNLSGEGRGRRQKWAIPANEETLKRRAE